MAASDSDGASELVMPSAFAHRGKEENPTKRSKGNQILEEMSVDEDMKSDALPANAMHWVGVTGEEKVRLPPIPELEGEDLITAYTEKVHQAGITIVIID